MFKKIYFVLTVKKKNINKIIDRLPKAIIIIILLLNSNRTMTLRKKQQKNS